MWTRSKVIPDCFTVSSETSDVYKSAERVPFMPVLDLNKVAWKRSVGKLHAATRNDIRSITINSARYQYIFPRASLIFTCDNFQERLMGEEQRFIQV